MCPKKVRRLVALRRPELTHAGILAWADSHHRRTGQWPTRMSGRVHENRNESWMAINSALILGLRGLPGGVSLAQLLNEERGVRNRKALPRLTHEQILAWARAYRRLTGKWPSENAGPIANTQGEVWNNVAAALSQGIRGLPGGDSLARLLSRRLGVRNIAARPRFRVPQILVWIDAHHARTGQWPQAKSGSIVGAAGETWAAVDDALRAGQRSLPGGSSLAKLLAARRGVRKVHDLPRLTISQIQVWAVAHRRRTGRWPGRMAGPIAEAPGETWSGVGQALRRGGRGLPGGESLHQLFLRRWGGSQRADSGGRHRG